MGHRFHDLAFTDAVKRAQTAHGSRASYRRFETAGDRNHVIGPNEQAFIGARDSFYMATTGADGWPYIQHRGGPPGFLRVLDERTLGFADLSGNRQYITVGNLEGNDRVALFLMDYGNRARLKILGRARVVTSTDAPELIERLTLAEYEARVERGIVIALEAFDWNCSQHIVERYTLADLAPTVEAFRSRIADLEAEVERLRAPHTSSNA